MQGSLGIWAEGRVGGEALEQEQCGDFKNRGKATWGCNMCWNGYCKAIKGPCSPIAGLAHS